MNQPPAYDTNSKYGSSNAQASGSTEPLLSHQTWETENSAEDDFKFGVTVAQSSSDIRNAFIRKVYSVLFVQILFSAVIGVFLSTESAKSYLQQNQWIVFSSMFGSLGAMGLVYWKRHSSPLNMVFLGLFTALEAILIGTITNSYDQTVVLQALIITTFVFAGLTLFTFQSKLDFSSMGGYLFGFLLVFLGTSIVGIFIPYSRVTDMIIAGAGVLLFSAYIVYDTSEITKRYSPDEWVLASLALYLDIVNLFLQILRLLSDLNRSD